jgi:hypothetical protein
VPHALRQLGAEIHKGAAQKLSLDVLGFGPIEVNAVEKDLIYDGLLNAEFLGKLLGQGRAGPGGQVAVFRHNTCPEATLW